MRVMIETIITLVIIAVAGAWFLKWFRSTANGERGCSCCGGCRRDDCPTRDSKKVFLK